MFLFFYFCIIIFYFGLKGFKQYCLFVLYIFYQFCTEALPCEAAVSSVFGIFDRLMLKLRRSGLM